MPTYVERRLRSGQDQENEERFMTILCRMHALHLAGPDAWWQLGATIVPAFKALEQRVQRDKLDLLLAIRSHVDNLESRIHSHVDKLESRINMMMMKAMETCS